MYFADLHIHSRFSRACSKQLNIENLEKWGNIKGLDLIGTGDFTHPVWLDELKKELKEEVDDKGNGRGVFIMKNKNGNVRFLLTGEISLMYTDDKAKEEGKNGRRVHLVLLAPDFEAVDKINQWLDTKGRRDYDGRPIFKISCEDFAAKMFAIDSRIEVIPAHIFTPWFGIFGSKTGFDLLKNAFKSQYDKIHAIETGISSDRSMNLRINEIRGGERDKGKTIMSNSDSHSFWPWRLGREATIFKSIESYDEVLREIRENDIIGTIEVEPAYGKYHYDGHRLCGFSCSPSETKKLNNICPKCGKELTLGVDYRVESLADEMIEEGKNVHKRDNKIEFKILPLHEILALSYGTSMNTKKIWNIYNMLIERFDNEFNILLKVSKEKLLKELDDKTTELIMKNRRGDIKVRPGYDGVYGRAVVESEQVKLS